MSNAGVRRAAAFMPARERWSQNDCGREIEWPERLGNHQNRSACDRTEAKLNKQQSVDELKS